MTPTLTDDDLRAMFKRCLNCGRWGDDDQAGTLNLITPVKRRRAARLVRSGRSGSFTRPLLCLLDYPEVTTLRAMCAAEGTQAFVLTCAPLAIPGGTGSAVNPIATF